MIVLNVTSTKVGAEMRQKIGVFGRNYHEGQNKSRLKNFNRTQMKQLIWIPQNASPDSAPPARDRVEDPGQGVLGQKGERRHVRPIAAHFLPSLF